ASPTRAEGAHHRAADRPDQAGAGGRRVRLAGRRRLRGADPHCELGAHALERVDLACLRTLARAQRPETLALVLLRADKTPLRCDELVPEAAHLRDAHGHDARLSEDGRARLPRAPELKAHLGLRRAHRVGDALVLLADLPDVV